MQYIYRDWLGQDEPTPHVPRVPTEPERSNYALDRSLETLGVDTALLSQRIRPYIQWCRGKKA